MVNLKYFLKCLFPGYYLKPQDMDTVEERTLNYHRLIETFKFAYAKRTGMGDDSFIDIKQVICWLAEQGAVWSDDEL